MIGSSANTRGFEIYAQVSRLLKRRRKKNAGEKFERVDREYLAARKIIGNMASWRFSKILQDLSISYFFYFHVYIVHV